MPKKKPCSYLFTTYKCYAQRIKRLKITLLLLLLLSSSYQCERQNLLRGHLYLCQKLAYRQRALKANRFRIILSIIGIEHLEVMHYHLKFKRAIFIYIFDYIIQQTISSE